MTDTLRTRIAAITARLIREEINIDPVWLVAEHVADAVIHELNLAKACQSGCVWQIPNRIEDMTPHRMTALIDAMIAARNTAHDAQQRFNYAWPSVDGRDEISDALYEATHELINRIDNMVTSVDWQNMMLKLDA